MDTLKDKIMELEKVEIIKALRQCGWVMARAARKLGISERMIVYKIDKYGIRSKEVRWVSLNGGGESGTVKNSGKEELSEDLGLLKGL
jgi:molybdenum-dependent DNA-binding transcriptional regulator ModE